MVHGMSSGLDGTIIIIKSGWMVWLCVPDQLCIIRRTSMNVRLGSLKIVVKTKHFVFV